MYNRLGNSNKSSIEISFGIENLKRVLLRKQNEVFDFPTLFFWLISLIKFSINILVVMKLLIVRGRKASLKTLYLFSLKASAKYVVFSLLAISQALPLFCASLECALEDENYEDGAETQVECNRCVCACGNWVCTAMTCEGLYALQTIIVFSFVQKRFLLPIFLRAAGLQVSSLSSFSSASLWVVSAPPSHAPCWPDPSWFCFRGQKVCNWAGGSAAGICSMDLLSRELGTKPSRPELLCIQLAWGMHRPKGSLSAAICVSISHLSCMCVSILTVSVFTVSLKQDLGS